MRVNICDHRKCRREATAAYDLKRNGFLVAGGNDRHYEVCAKHDQEFFGRGPWIDDKTSALIKQELVPS